MTTYTLPRDAYELLVEALGEKQKAEVFARALERSIQAIEERADAAIVEKKGHIQIELKDELRQELVTRELFDGRFKSLEKEMNERFKSLERGVNERFNVVDEKFKSLEAEQREQRREMGEFRQEVNERFDRMHERFDQMYQHFETLFDRQNRHAETRFDNMNKLIVSQTRWMVGSTVGFGTLITIVLAISQFTP